MYLPSKGVEKVINVFIISGLLKGSVRFFFLLQLSQLSHVLTGIKNVNCSPGLSSFPD